MRMSTGKYFNYFFLNYFGGLIMPLSKTFFIVFFLVTSLLFAQNEKSENEKEKVNSLEKGSWSLQFQIANNFQLKSFSGQTISAKYHLTESSAIRAGISIFNRSYDEEDQENDEANNFFSVIRTGREDFDITIMTEYIFYINPKNLINFFAGGGLIYGYNSNDMTGERINYRLDTLSSTEKTKRFTNSHKYGVTLSTGIEWFVNSYISLHAEYNTQLYLSETKGNEERTRKNFSAPILISKVYTDSDRNDFIINSYSVKFGLSVYF